MTLVSQISGVTLEVYKQDRRLVPEGDGYVGKLYSGFATILAVVDPAAAPTFGLFRDGQDHYVLQKDWLNNPRTASQQQAHKMFLAGRDFAEGTRVYGVKMPLRVDSNRAINTVHYPENMLALAQYCSGEACGNPKSADYVLVWKIALVSQFGEFFLTVQEAYDVMICKDAKGKLRVPRLNGHRLLERLILANAPENFKCADGADSLPESGALPRLKENEGIVDRWYDARNMGCILTKQGSARVHWSEVPPRPRRRFLVAGERVKFASLQTPPENPSTDFRKMRQARFNLQACGIEMVSDQHSNVA